MTKKENYTRKQTAIWCIIYYETLIEIKLNWNS